MQKRDRIIAVSYTHLAVCMAEIEEVIKELPAILEEKQFQKLMKEYGFRVEGGKVWEEN